MNNVFKRSLCTFLLGTAMALVSCQEEEPLEETIDVEQTLVVHAEEMELLKRVVDKDGSYDNIVDGSSCLAVQFPYTVVINEYEVEVDSMEGLQLIEDHLDAIECAEEVLQMNIVFPVTVTLSDYTELTIGSADELDEISRSCVEGGDDDDIECVDLVYPLTVFTYNPNFQLLNTLEVGNDMQFRRFFAGLDDSDLISFGFPISLEYGNGDKVAVNSNSELADAIENAQMTCDEDDDNDYNDDDFNEESLGGMLVKCPWQIQGLKTSTQGDNEQYTDYFLTFTEGGNVSVGSAYGYAAEGTWSTGVSDYRVVLEVHFGDAPDFNGTWGVYGLGEEKIKLFSGEGDDQLLLEMACDFEPNACAESHIREYLKECRWQILGEDGTFFDDLTLDFSAEMSVLVYNSEETVVDEGSWSVSGNVVAFSKLSKTLANYIGDWEVVECGDTQFGLKRRDEVIVLKIKCEE